MIKNPSNFQYFASQPNVHVSLNRSQLSYNRIQRPSQMLANSQIKKQDIQCKSQRVMMNQSDQQVKLPALRTSQQLKIRKNIQMPQRIPDQYKIVSFTDHCINLFGSSWAQE